MIIAYPKQALLWTTLFVFPFLTVFSLHTGLRCIEEIYVINLDRRPERWLNTCKQLEPFGLHLTRFAAINGWEMERRALKDAYRNYVEKSHRQSLTPGQVGCFLSHYTILQEALSKNYGCIWVLEDDIIVLNDIKELDDLILQLELLDPEWDLLFTDIDTRGLQPGEIWTFDTFLAGYFDYSLVKDPLFVPKETQSLKRIEYRLGTHSMILSRRGIKKLLQYFSNHKISLPIDIQMHCCPDKHFYVSKKEYVTHGERHGSDTSFNPNL